MAGLSFAFLDGVESVWSRCGVKDHHTKKPGHLLAAGVDVTTSTEKRLPGAARFRVEELVDGADEVDGGWERLNVALQNPLVGDVPAIVFGGVVLILIDDVAAEVDAGEDAPVA
jgi:hypothetical protein